MTTLLATSVHDNSLVPIGVQLTPVAVVSTYCMDAPFSQDKVTAGFAVEHDDVVVDVVVGESKIFPHDASNRTVSSTPVLVSSTTGARVGYVVRGTVDSTQVSRNCGTKALMIKSLNMTSQATPSQSLPDSHTN